MAFAVFWTILTTTGLLVSTVFAESGKQATLADSDYQKLAAPPTVSQFLRQTYIAVRELAFDWEKYPYDHDFTVRMFTDGLPNRYETCFIIVVTLSFILFRAIVDPPLREWLRRKNFREVDAEKFPECFFRSLYYIGITAYGAHVIYLSGRHTFFQEPCTCFDMIPDYDLYFSRPVPADLQLLYGIQFSYYLANVYMVQYQDTKKKDTGLMLAHHLVTLLLIGFSYLARYLKVGCIVYLLHDVSDAYLETGKLLVYSNGRENKRHPFCEFMSSFLFLGFAGSWFFLRIYLFPLRMLHATNWCVYLKRDIMIPRFYLFFNLLLLALVLMHHIWGWLIIRMVVRIFLRPTSRLEDIREEGEPNGHAMKDKTA